MNKIQHASIPQVVTLELVDSLIKQVETTPMPRIRAASIRQLYSIGVVINEISDALQRDLESGDRILNKKSNDEQNAAPESQLWIDWLHQYELAQKQLQRISSAIATADSEAA